METVTFELGVLERMLLIQLLAPVQGDITRLKQMREFRETLSFTDEEREKFGITAVGDNVAWSNAEAVPFPISFEFVNLIKAELTKLNKMEQLTQDHVPLYELFVGG